MKNNTPDSNFLNRSAAMEKTTSKNTQKKTTSPTKPSKDMTAQLITPPSRVWNNIEAILDEQDKRRQSADDIIAASFGINRSASAYKKFFIATTAFLSLVAGLIWIVF